MRSYRILTGKTTRLAVPTRLIGHLWRDGGETTRAMLSVALESDVLDACYRVAEHGPYAGKGTGNKLDYTGRRRAQQRPDDEFDRIVVQRVLQGRHQETTRREQEFIVRHLTDQGRSARQIGALLGISQRHVSRLRSRVKGANS